MQEEEDAASCLIADAGDFFRARGFCQQNLRAVGILRPDQDPAFVPALGSLEGVSSIKSKSSDSVKKAIASS